MSYILTHSGRQVSYENAEVPSTGDIALSLSRLPRFGGHTSVPWSVLDHVLFCYDLARATPDLRYGAPSLGLAMLLHDAHEACTGDIPSPLKTPDMSSMQFVLDLKIMDAYFPGGHDAYDVLHNLVKQIDRAALLVEAYMVGPPSVRGSENGVLEHFGANPRFSDLTVFRFPEGRLHRTAGQTHGMFLDLYASEDKRVLWVGA